jgi:branched-chain amino acid aminotransferase
MAETRQRKTMTYFDGTWHDGSPPILSAFSHGMWMSSVVFDGARSIGGATPDLDRHCARLVASARTMGLEPVKTGPEIEELAREGIAQFPADMDLYICPMMYAEEGFIVPEPESTRFVMNVREAPLPEPKGFKACRSSFRRPAKDMALTECKASALYPNVARAVREARSKGFDTGVIMDPSGNVAEFAHTNLFMAKDGAVHTPVPNGTFLNGLTRQRLIQLLRDDGVEVVERSIAYDELADADELFSSANATKVMPCIRLEDRDLQPGPMFTRARALYMDFVRSCVN